MEIEDNIQWHPAFCSAMELELRDYKEYLQYEREHNLGKMPLRIDFLVIKKKPEAVIKNDIGDFFLGNNIFEYKSPGDEVNTGTLYKVLAYACLYESENGGLEDALNPDTTISLVREQKPTKLLKQLEQKYSVTRKSAGIYRISDMLFPMQILVTGELDKNTHIWVTSLTKTLDRERMEVLIGSCSGLVDEEDKRNADSVLNVTSEANIRLFKELIQEGGQMCEELKELLAPEIIELRVRLADKDAQITEQTAQITEQTAQIIKLKALLAEAGIQV